jgi:predicted nucleotidyltransferase
MHFHDLPERLVGSRSRVAVLKLLVASPGVEWTGREIARRAKVSPTQGLSALRVFEEEGICRQRRVGRSSVWTLAPDHFLTKALSSLARLDQEAQSRLQRALSRALAGSGATEAYVFGSVASGREEASSDIDLLVVFPDGRRLEDWQGRLDSLRSAVQVEFANFLSPKVFTVAQARRGSAKRLLHEARTNGVPVDVAR